MLMGFGKTKTVFSNRSDGLGERLCAMINAMRIADVLDIPFGISWTDKVWNPDYEQLTADKTKHVIGQSIIAKEMMFSKDFIQACVNNTIKKSDLAPFPKAGLSKDAVKAAKTMGWVTDQRYLEKSCSKEFLATLKMSSAEAFDQIGFSLRIRTIISEARQLDLPPFVALHLRSGDMVYGKVREWGLWGDKVINPLIAGDIIEKAKKKGQSVLVFGQDQQVLKGLQKAHGVHLAGTFSQLLGYNATERAMFEIILMSRATDIISGDSGFSRAASMIAGKNMLGIFSQYSAIGYSDVTLAALKNPSIDLHPMMAAYAYWQAYAFGRTLRSVPQLIEIVTKAAELDPANEMYNVIRAALHYRLGADDAAENIIKARLAAFDGGKASIKHPFIKQLLFRYFTPKFVHDEQFDDYIAAAHRPNNPQAKELADLIKNRAALTGLAG